MFVNFRVELRLGAQSFRRVIKTERRAGVMAPTIHSLTRISRLDQTVLLNPVFRLSTLKNTVRNKIPLQHSSI
jgi:hypothetical protein